MRALRKGLRLLLVACFLAVMFSVGAATLPGQQPVAKAGFKRHYLLTAYLLGMLLIVLLTSCGNSQTGPTSSNSESTSQPPQVPIVGTWIGVCNLISESNSLEFRTDGTVLIGSYVLQYTINGNRLQLTSGGSTQEYTFSISSSGNVLKLFNAQNKFCTMPKDGSSGIEEIKASVVGKWTANCGQNESLEFHSDGTGIDSNIGNFTYIIPKTGDKQNYATLEFSPGKSYAQNWYTFLVSDDGKTLQLSSLGTDSCTFTRSS